MRQFIFFKCDEKEEIKYTENDELYLKEQTKIGPGKMQTRSTLYVFGIEASDAVDKDNKDNKNKCNSDNNNPKNQYNQSQTKDKHKQTGNFNTNSNGNSKQSPFDLANRSYSNVGGIVGQHPATVSSQYMQQANVRQAQIQTHYFQQQWPWQQQVTFPGQGYQNSIGNFGYNMIGYIQYE